MISLAPAIEFWVAGIPKSMAVGKSVRWKNKSGGTNSAQQRVNTEWALIVGEIARRHVPSSPLSGAIVLTLKFFMPKPKSARKTDLFPIKRPDIDNLTHKISDQFNGVLWKDDSQVVDMIVKKRYTPTGAPGLLVTVEEIDEP